MRKIIRIGSRESKLAVMQTRLVMDQIKQLHPDWELELVTMKTTGDKILNKTLDKVGGKGLFVKELHQALLRKDIDIAVHSLKDMPMEEDPKIPIMAYIKRGDPRDCLVCREGEFQESSGIGTSSLRRKLQLEGRGIEKEEIKNIRGNIVTRLKKLDEGEYDALVLAAAGLIRAGLEERITKYYETDEMLPAAGQGILAVQCRSGFEPKLMEELNDIDTMYAALAERGFVRALNGGCSSPVAAYAQIKDDWIILEGLYYDGESGHFWKRMKKGKKEEAERIGISLAMEMKRPGKVWLVGAGPSDPGLMTLKGKHVLEEADVVVYDHLIGEGVKQMIPSRAQTIDAGKQAGNHRMKQEEINRILLEKALEGKNVVRLKGGDPFLFGRGAEELELLYRANIPFEIVPGVSSAFAVPAYAGIPMTHRDIASTVHIIAGQRKQGNQDIDFRSLAALRNATLVFLMGIRQLEFICKGLLEAGLAKDTKAAVLENGTTFAQKTVFGTLETLPELSKKEKIGTPGIIVVGDVCCFGNQFGWVEKRPLHGMRIWVTRPEKKDSRLAEMLYDLGAEVLKIPTIETKILKDYPYLKENMGQLEEYDWMVFTSQTSVEAFFAFIKREKIDIRQLKNIRFAALGKVTANCLLEKGIQPDFVPEYSDGKVMAERFEKIRKNTESILVFTPLQEPGQLAIELEKRKIPFDRIPLYETKPISHKEVPVMEGDFFAFASASAVRGMALGRNPEELKGKVAVCIGEKTAKEARRYGFSVRVSRDTTINSMVETFLKLKEEYQSENDGGKLKNEKIEMEEE